MKLPSLVRRRVSQMTNLRGLALAALLSLTCALIGRAGEEDILFGGSGGDSIGSLPMVAPGGPAQPESASSTGPIQTVGPFRPSVTLAGSAADVLAVVLSVSAAGPDACYAVVNLPDGRIRVEFYGRLDLVLDRNRLSTLPVNCQIRIGSTFQGGTAQIFVAGEPRSIQALPLGLIPLPLQQLSNSGVLLLGMQWRARSPEGSLQRVLNVTQSGAVIRLEQRD
ncbi:MAG: hypothetical protein JNN27_19140 [Planctomycetes bacterium]|nr:hypothetical protein [Planctomycetota bacterium]